MRPTPADLLQNLLAPYTGGSDPMAGLQQTSPLLALAMQTASGGGSPATFGRTGGGKGFNLPQGGTATLRKFLTIARNQVGDPYVFAAEGPNTFDCSGLVSFALQHAGVDVPRMSAAGFQQMFQGSETQNRQQLRPGDLMFYHYSNDRGIGPGSASHIDIYLGNGRSVGASGSAVHVSPVDWDSWLGAARVPGLFHR